MQGELAEVLDHDLGLLGDVVRMQAHEPRQGPGRLALVHLGIVLDGLDQPVVGLVGRVVLEHVEDEALLDGLAHGVEVEGLGLAVGPRPAEDLQRLVLGRGREGEEADVGLPAPLGHGLEDFCPHSRAGSPQSAYFARLFADDRGRQDAFQFRRRLARPGSCAPRRR